LTVLARGMASVILVVVAGLSLSGCGRRSGLNFDCEWVGDQSFEIDLDNTPQVRHLLDDIQAAEELSIRYGDRIAGWRLVETFGVVSRHGGLKNRDAGRLAHQKCIDQSFSTISAKHGLSVAEIEGRACLSVEWIFR
jgi:hypothetical protein